MKKFKKQAEDWADKILEGQEQKEDYSDLLEMMVFGSISYHYDKDGNRRKLSLEELDEFLREKENKDRI